jgi:hypothetical protein
LAKEIADSSFKFIDGLIDTDFIFPALIIGLGHNFGEFVEIFPAVGENVLFNFIFKDFHPRFISHFEELVDKVLMIMVMMMAIFTGILTTATGTMIMRFLRAGFLVMMTVVVALALMTHNQPPNCE